MQTVPREFLLNEQNMMNMLMNTIIYVQSCENDPLNDAVIPRLFMSDLLLAKLNLSNNLEKFVC